VALVSQFFHLIKIQNRGEKERNLVRDLVSRRPQDRVVQCAVVLLSIITSPLPFNRRPVTRRYPSVCLSVCLRRKKPCASTCRPSL